MDDIFATPVHDQRGHYNSAAHESFRAVCRSLCVTFGNDEAHRRARGLLDFMRVRYPSQLSPDGVYHCRKLLEKALPLRGDFVS